MQSAGVQQIEMACLAVWENAFTPIELLVAMIGILAALLFPVFACGHVRWRQIDSIKRCEFTANN